MTSPAIPIAAPIGPVPVALDIAALGVPIVNDPTLDPDDRLSGSLRESSIQFTPSEIKVMLSFAAVAVQSLLSQHVPLPDAFACPFSNWTKLVKDAFSMNIT
jgi:hypothetical protein